ncbi:YlbF family regulator [Tuberibacillus sp. Marseille-P3662]|uniref:YlbF family regulator n=1 Tax=Tuberibacillus sp. Marseille-P3662 TaxID=1965358 RepID=UPI000A1C8111|nr:YlbF family regulator [Tuberibacillus sp. Marseille-P3662]
MSNPYDVAYELETAIRNSKEYTALKDAYAAVNEDEPASKMFENFRNLQLELQRKQMQGEEISEEEAQQAQQQMQLIQQQPTIAKLMEAEQSMSTIINELNQIITKPLEELYGTSDQAQQ